jgi:Asp-tRNA(Asn)/Glu-tRNA(Gln) amidotransferase A subunit family amidase
MLIPWFGGSFALFLAATIFATAMAAQPRRFDLATAGIAEIQDAVAAGALGYEQLVRRYLARIAAYDQQGPRLNAVIAINPRALDEARARDEERRTKGPRGPLHGIPLAVKDNIDTSDLPTTGGSLAFAGSTPLHDATVVARLRAAGAIILVKTNLDELALDSKGLSSLGRQTLNPYDLSRSPGGSSGGTAVAVAAGFVTAGLATETGLSIRGPAANTGIVGLAPSRGLVSRTGVMPISFTQDRVGVHARSVADAAILLSAIQGLDPEDLSTTESLGRVSGAYREKPGAPPSAARIGILRDLFRTGAEFTPAHAVVEATLAEWQQQGVVLVDHVRTGENLVGQMPTLRVNSFELGAALASYLRHRGPASPVMSPEGFIASGKYLKGGNLETRFRENRTVGNLEENREYLRRLAAQRRLRQRLEELMVAHNVDALAYPTKGLPAPPLGTSDAGPRDNAISSTTGLPALVLPAGLTPDGLPVALELLGRPFSEARLIELGRLFERATRVRLPPTTTPPLSGDVVIY